MKILTSIFCCLALVLFYFAPVGYSLIFSLLSLFIFIALNIFYFLFSSKGNGVGFEFFFMIAFCMTNFIYPVFYFPDNRYVSLFSFGFNISIMNKSTALALVAYSFYIMGLQLYKKKSIALNRYNELTIDSFFQLCFLFFSLISFVLFVFFGGLDHFKSVYSGDAGWAEVGIFSYFFLIFNFSSMLLAMFVFKGKNTILRLISIIFLLSSLLLLLYSGSRMTAIGLALILLVSYSLNVKRISLASASIVVFVSSIFLYIIMLYRSTFIDSSTSQVDIYGNLSNNFSFFDGFMDLIINNRNLYVLVDFVDSNGSVYFTNIFYNFISFLPFSQMINNMVGIPEYLNGNLVSFLEFGKVGGFGLGTNNVGEAYLSFGILGVVIFFTFFGYLLSLVKDRASISIVYYIIYFVLVSVAVIYPRGSILINSRVFVWTLLIFFMIHFLKKILLKVTRGF